MDVICFFGWLFWRCEIALVPFFEIRGIFVFYLDIQYLMFYIEIGGGIGIR